MLSTSGTCACGCGEKTKIATRNDHRDGTKKGQPVLYVRGHHRRKSFVEYIEEDRGYSSKCWIWQKATNTDPKTGGIGHGHVFDGEKMRPAHIVYYERKYGRVPEGHELHHLCEQKPCVNPDHVNPVTDAEHKQSHAHLTPQIVREIRSSKDTKRDLAVRYGVSVSNIKMILLGKTWKNVD